jgi:probable F420-dependent oxidoreductase
VPRLQFTVQFPLDRAEDSESVATPAAVTGFARAVEEAGFHALGFTEHPAPPAEWLAGRAGHASLDPFAALGFCAAVTTRIQLMTFLAVLPYRNAYVTAKAATTVDRLSSGRMVLAVGSGYLREEFEALGIDFDRRVADTEAALRTLHAAWSGKPGGPALRPRPATEGGPPVWVGGNSARARRTAARWGSGWSPLLVPGDMAGSLGTAGLGSLADLRRGIEDLHRAFSDAGRDPAEAEIQVKGPFSRIREGWRVEEHLAVLEELGAAGVTRVVVHPTAATPQAAEDLLREYGSAVVARVS